MSVSRCAMSWIDKKLSSSSVFCITKFTLRITPNFGGVGARIHLRLTQCNLCLILSPNCHEGGKLFMCVVSCRTRNSMWQKDETTIKKEGDTGVERFHDSWHEAMWRWKELFNQMWNVFNPFCCCCCELGNPMKQSETEKLFAWQTKSKTLRFACFFPPLISLEKSF